MSRAETWSSLRIVVLDPDPGLRVEIAAVLGAAGHCTLAATGDHALALDTVAGFQPEIFLMDVDLGNANGVAVAARAAELGSQVIVVSSRLDRGTVKRAVAAGVASFVSKPISEVRLLAAIEMVSSRADIARARRREIDEAAKRFETREIVERAKFLLMDECGFNEPQAYRHLQLRSMNTRRSMREVAEAVITTYETALGVEPIGPQHYEYRRDETTGVGR